MARGADAKAKISKGILDNFEGSFLNDKEIRIPVEENGEIIEIKITMTAAKTNIKNYDGGIAEAKIEETSLTSEDNSGETLGKEQLKVTKEEQDKIKALMAELNL